jgi:hypothetical protein
MVRRRNETSDSRPETLGDKIQALCFRMGLGMGYSIPTPWSCGSPRAHRSCTCGADELQRLDRLSRLRDLDLGEARSVKH